MRALCFNRASNQLEVVKIPEPSVRSTEDVKIRVHYATVGPEEMRIKASRTHYSKDGIVGLEMSGEIVDLGEQAKLAGFSVGDLVTGHPFQYCSTCRACRSGRRNCCTNPLLVSGTICEYLVWKSSQLAKLSGRIPMREASLLASVAEALEAIERGRVGFHSRVLIWGGNYMSLLLIQLAKHSGAQEITVIDPLTERKPLEQRLGADHVLSPLNPNFSLSLHSITDFTGFDTVLECSGVSESLDSVIEFLAKGGTAVIMTCYEKPIQMHINAPVFYVGNYTITGVLSFNQKLDLAEQIAPSLCLKELISNECTMEQAPQMFSSFDISKHYKMAIRVK